MLTVEGLEVRYGGIRAVNEVSFSVPRGKLVAILGSNGAGKSSVLAAVCGLVRPRKGRIIFDGRRIDGQSARRSARAGIVLVPEGRRILATLTVQENLELGRVAARGRAGDSGWDLPTIYSLFPVLADRSRQKAGLLSGGEQQMLALGRGLMARPKILLLDEPSLGLAPIVTQQVFEVLDQLRSDGLTMLLVEQSATRALAAADYAYVLATGDIVGEGPAETLGFDETVATYLGSPEPI